MDAKQRFSDWFRSCVEMRETLDAEKCQDFHGMRQGFMVVKLGNQARVTPFHYTSPNMIPKVIDMLFERIGEGKVAAIYWCKSYLIYSTPSMPRIVIENGGDDPKTLNPS